MHYHTSSQDVYETIKYFGSDIKVLHVHDDKRKTDGHRPFTGSIDWKGFVKGLREIGFNGDMFMETTMNRSFIDFVRKDYFKVVSKIARYLADEVSR